MIEHEINTEVTNDGDIIINGHDYTPLLDGIDNAIAEYSEIFGVIRPDTLTALQVWIVIKAMQADLNEPYTPNLDTVKHAFNESIKGKIETGSVQ